MKKDVNIKKTAKFRRRAYSGVDRAEHDGRVEIWPWIRSCLNPSCQREIISIEILVLSIF
jgi:hypothetical protein